MGIIAKFQTEIRKLRQDFTRKQQVFENEKIEYQ